MNAAPMRVELLEPVMLPSPPAPTSLWSCAFAPASVGNVAVGFDLLGHSMAGIGDRAEVRRIDEPVVRIAAIRGCVAALPTDPRQNTAGVALLALRKALGLPASEAASTVSVPATSCVSASSGTPDAAAGCP